jgi:hypothetical protein
MAAAESTITRIGSLIRSRRARTSEVQAVAEVTPIHETNKLDPAESPLLHPGAVDALLLAAAPLGESRRPVAVVLEDGTVRSLLGERSGDRPFDTGSVSGPDWTLWWERRTLAGA